MAEKPKVIDLGEGASWRDVAKFREEWAAALDGRIETGRPDVWAVLLAATWVCIGVEYGLMWVGVQEWMAFGAAGLVLAILAAVACFMHEARTGSL